MGSCSSHDAVASDVDARFSVRTLVGTFDAIRNADDCARALEMAIQVMDPPLEVYNGILRRIADFAGPYYNGEQLHRFTQSRL